jgi:IclR family KDG regulon transcriptional repressor
MNDSKRLGPQTIHKAIALLRAFTPDAPELGVRKLAEMLDMPKSTVHRLLVALEQEGFVEQDARTGLYRLGFELVILAGYALGSLDVRRVALSYMDQLAERWKETVDLDVLRGAHIVIVEQIPGRHVLNTGGAWATRLPAHCTSTGKVLLAYAGREYVEKHLPAELERYTPHTVTTREALLEELAQVREQGYARSWGERDEFVNAVGVPIRGLTGEVVAAMSISGLSARFDERTAMEMVDALKQAAKEISAHLGYAAPR